MHDSLLFNFVFPYGMHFSQEELLFYLQKKIK